MGEFDEEGLATERDNLLAQARTLLIAASEQGRDLPDMGVTPMVRHNGAIYIYPSHLSSHVRAMLAAGKAAFLVIEDEASAQNIWARKRLKFNADLSEIERKSAEFNDLCGRFSAVHGPTMELIRDFADFHLLRLRPTGGVMVLGFAQAYRLEGADLRVTAHLRAS